MSWLIYLFLIFTSLHFQRIECDRFPRNRLQGPDKEDSLLQKLANESRTQRETLISGQPMRWNERKGRNYLWNPKHDMWNVTPHESEEKRLERKEEKKKEPEGRAKSIRMYGAVILLLVVFKIVGVFAMSLTVIILYLLKVAILAKLSLFISGIVFVRKLFDHSVSLISKSRYGFLLPYDVGQYKDTKLDLSGYGYNSYRNEHLIPDYVRSGYYNTN